MDKNNLEYIVFGGGCFWCVESCFNMLKGVHEAVSGYSGGTVDNPTYEAVCTGETGHAEVVQITFNSRVISYKELVEIFLTTHDPTTLNRQGADVGTQYRSVIYFHNDSQKELAKQTIDELSKYFDKPIVTELSPLQKFHEAEDYHQNYYQNNETQGYCSFVITPKLAKLRQMHADKLKG